MMEKSLQSSGLETLPIQACEVTRHQKKKTVDLQGISILVVDHDPSTIRNLKRTLQGFGAELHLAGDLWSAKRIIAHEQIHIIVAELYLKDGSAMDLFPLYKSLNPEGLFYLTSTKTSLDLAQHAIKLGVNHVLEKPIEGEKLAQMAFHLLQARFTSLATTDPLNRILKPYLLFRSAVMKQGLSVLPQIAKSNHSVLITGESGTGK
ncbi:MAG: DNA-binding NtrC family response regulator, partial [bacterium]